MRDRGMWNRHLLRERKVRRSLGRYILLGGLIGAVLLCRLLILVWLVMMLSQFFALWESKRQAVPEIMYFLPIEKKERRSYFWDKAFLLAGGSSMAMLAAWVSVFLLVRGDVGGVQDTGNLFLMVFTYYLSFRERILLTECAKYRRLEPWGFRKLCCPLWYQILYICSTLLQWGVLLFGLFQGMIFDVTQGGISEVSYPWEIGLGIIVLVLLVGHILCTRYLFSVIDRGDADLSVAVLDIV